MNQNYYKIQLTSVLFKHINKCNMNIKKDIYIIKINRVLSLEIIIHKNI